MLGALKMVSLASANGVNPLELKSAMASARRWGEGGMGSDLIGNIRAVFYSEKFLQNDVSEYLLNLCIVSAIVGFFAFFRRLQAFSMRPLIKVVQLKHGYITRTSRWSD